jgi:hypothetical protein
MEHLLGYSITIGNKTTLINLEGLSSYKIDSPTTMKLNWGSGIERCLKNSQIVKTKLHS